ncbi:INO80 complex subunit C isoform X2 [Ranitomeya variabilis]|uniref:INO80 complex subunit C isoform X2 n=1 Tax=Ranitomeya variabilis TaxID=490064 RepID=UPI004056BAF4
MSDKTAAADASSHTDAAAKPLPFKQPGFLHSGIGGAAAGKKNRTWKNLKQILALERALPWQLNDPSYFNIDAPPSCKPAKKYSDISGLPVLVLLAAWTGEKSCWRMKFSSTKSLLAEGSMKRSKISW